MKNKRMDNERPRRRFREAVDGPAIRRWYARMRTVDLARMQGLTIKSMNKPEHVVPGYLYAIFHQNEQNSMTASNVETAKAKGWKVLRHNGNNWVDYAGE